MPKRTPWPAGFPDVVIHTTVPARDAHPAYAAAKSGDAEAALRLGTDLLDVGAIEQLRTLIAGRPAVLLPVIADETLGFNAIPDGMAQVLRRSLRLPVRHGEIVQLNKVGHTRAPAFQRLVTPAEFGGPVRPGQAYVLIDDHVGLGGTLANLRGHIEARLGRVIGITTLTESRDARRIALRSETRDVLWSRHGADLDRYWTERFEHGVDCLTEVEALQLCRQQSLVQIKNFLAKATVEAGLRGLETGAG